MMALRFLRRVLAGALQLPSLSLVLVLVVILGLALLGQLGIPILNPGTILELVVVYATFRGGMRTGAVSALLAWLYLAYYFSMPGRVAQYTSEDLRRLLVLTLTLPASVLMIGHLYTRSQLVTQAEEAQTRAEAATAHLRTIKHLTEATLAHLRLDELLPELLTRIQAILSVDTVVVLLVDDTGTMLVATAARGLEEEVQQGVRIPVGAGFAGRIASERHPIALDRIDDTTVINPLLRQKGIQALLGVPLLLEGRVIGVLHVGSLTPRHFTLEETTLLQLVADRAALIIEHARLSEELQQLALVDERNRIAMDMHDGVLQSLYAIGLRLEECLDLVSEEPEEAITQLDQAIASINAAMGEIRRYIFNLRPLEIQGRTFPQTVQTLVTEFQANMHLPVAVQLAPDVPSRLPAGDATVLLQMIREVLMNAAKHAQASQIELDLERVKTDLQVTIRDNGRGFDLSRPVGTDHHGLRNLRERAAALGGQVDVSSSVGAGTQVQITIPVKG